jgi:hypothetical protein
MVVDPQIRKFCGPLFFSSSNVTPKDNVAGSGSFGLVRIGDKYLLVTCWHVLFQKEYGFKDMHSLNPVLRFAIGFGGRYPHSVSFEDLMKMKVDDERRCDLVTFDISDALDLVAASNLEFFDLNANQPPKVRDGDALFLIGFPSKGRVENEASIGFPRQLIGVHASQVGESNFFAEATNLKIDETDVGGISGAPCFVVQEGKPPKLVGFSTGYAPSKMNLLQFTYARYIGKDGIIRYMS